MKLSQLMTKVSLGVALAGSFAVTLPSASYAFGEHRYYYSNEDGDGTVWDYYRGYFSNESDQNVESTRPRAPARTNRAPRRNVSEPAQAPDRPSCLVDANGACR